MEVKRTKAPLTEQMKSLKKGDELVCPASELNKAQAYASRYGFQWGRVFSTRIDKEKKCVLIIRRS